MGVCWNKCFCGKELLIGVLLLDPGIGGSIFDDGRLFSSLAVGLDYFAYEGVQYHLVVGEWWRL